MNHENVTRDRSIVAVVAALALVTVSSAVARSTGAERAAAVQNAVPRTSGVLTIGATPNPYLIEGTGLTCIVVGPAPLYPPLFPDRLKQRIRFVYVDFKNSWNFVVFDELMAFISRLTPS